MKIERLVLKNFRGIREMDLEFNEKLTVLIGPNGAGKSSILHAMALPLSDVFKQPPYWEKGEMSGVKNSDILNGESSAQVEVFLKTHGKPDHPDFHLGFSRDESQGVDGTATSTLNKSPSVGQMEESLRRDRKSSGSLLAVRYLPERRIGRGHAEPVSADVLAPKFAYRSALTSGWGHRQFFSWFRKVQNADLQSLQVPWARALDMLKNGEQPPGTNAHLHAARMSIADFMHANALHYDFGENTFFVDKDGQTMSVNQLSDGEKGLLGLVGNLTYRLAVAYSHLTDANELPREAEAVVMIDEMELHLHPKWQRTVVPRLLETFPNVQFIITTHSPQVLGEIHSKDIILLEDAPQGIQHGRFSREVHGMTSGHILEALMGARERTGGVEDAIREASAAIERNDLQRAKELLAELSEDSRDIPELERIAMRIRREEAIGQ